MMREKTLGEKLHYGKSDLNAFAGDVATNYLRNAPESLELKAIYVYPKTNEVIVETKSNLLPDDFVYDFTLYGPQINRDRLCQKLGIRYRPL